MAPEILLPLTPLQSLLGFDYLPYRYNGAIELAFAFFCFAAAIALRRRRWVITSPSFMMLGLGVLIDLIGGSAVSNPKTRERFCRRRGTVVLLGRGPSPDGRRRLRVAPRARYFEHLA